MRITQDVSAYNEAKGAKTLAGVLRGLYYTHPSGEFKWLMKSELYMTDSLLLKHEL